jgi:carbamoyl-phosphate synthase large subunit
MTNILILSAGRRVSLVRGFQEAGAMRGVRVFAADAAPGLSAAAQVADRRFELPRVSDPAYADALFGFCLREDVRLVVPTIDPELPVLAALRARFEAEGVSLLVCDPALIDDFADKRRTAAFFAARGLETAKIFARDAVQYPVFVKPFDGSLSAGAMLIRSEGEMTPTIRDNPRNIFCEYIDHSAHAEFTCDLYFDRVGALKCAVPRQRIEVRGGEVSKGRTTKGEVEEIFFSRLNRIDGARGVLTVQLFRNNDTGRLIFNEVNARFGGGYPLTRHAGADYQAWLIDEYLLGKAPEIRRDWKGDVLMLRYDAEVILGA